MSLVAAHREVVGVGDSVDDAIDGLVKKLTTLAAAGWSVDGTIAVDPELAERGFPIPRTWEARVSVTKMIEVP